MRIYDFLEYYPNPYKPSIDTELVELLRSGHDVTVFAHGAYTTTLHDAFVEHNLQARTRYYPATLRHLARHGPKALGRFLESPLEQTRRARRVTKRPGNAKSQLINVVRGWLFPVESPDLCYVHNLVTAAQLIFLRELYPQARLCMYFHGGEVGGNRKVENEREIFRVVDSVVSNTRFSAAQIADRGCPPEKLAVIPVGFKIADYAPPADRRYRPDGKLRLVSVGRVSAEKGLLCALDALRQLLVQGFDGFSYSIVGVGTQLALLQAYVNEHGLSGHVSFAGELKKREVIEELQRSDVLLLPSAITATWAETQAACVQEALLMKCLTVTSVAGGVPESNAEEMRQFSVPPDDSAAIADSIRRIMALDDDSLRTLGEAGRTFALCYDIEDLMRKILVHATSGLPRGDPARFDSHRI